MDKNAFDRMGMLGLIAIASVVYFPFILQETTGELDTMRMAIGVQGLID